MLNPTTGFILKRLVSHFSIATPMLLASTLLMRQQPLTNCTNCALRCRPEQFNVDIVALEAAYKQLHRKLHPDNFATHSAAEQSASSESAMQINHAFTTLRSPLSRAHYLVRLSLWSTQNPPLFVNILPASLV